jgi:hypothetical protein
MANLRIILGCLIVAAAASVLGAAQPDYSDFERYQVILNRKPFGEPPVQAAPQPILIPPGSQQDPLRNIRLSSLTFQESYGIRIGLVDIAGNPPKSHFLEIGESTDEGIKVLDADMELEGVVLEKDGIKRWFQMSGGGAGSAGTPGPVAAAGAIPPPPGQAPAVKGSGPANLPESYIERLKKRRAEARKLMEEPVDKDKPALTGEALEKHLQEYNLDLIRKAARGEEAGPPLPIQLTPEQDRILVEEGVLPEQ